MAVPEDGKVIPITAAATTPEAEEEAGEPGVLTMFLDASVRMISEVAIVAPPSGLIERVVSFKVGKCDIVVITTVGGSGSGSKVIVLGQDGQVAGKIGFAPDEEMDEDDDEEEAHEHGD